MHKSSVTPADSSAPHTNAKPRILVVEDDADQRSALAQRLRFEGYEAMFAADAPSATRLARISRPDLIILDLGLPGGDGYLVMERLRMIPALSTIPVLVLSAREATQEKERARAAGAFAYHQKPITNVALRAAIQQGLSG